MQPRSRAFFVRVTNAAPAASVMGSSSGLDADSIVHSKGHDVRTGGWREGRGSDGLLREPTGDRLLESVRQAHVPGDDDLRLTGEERRDDVGVELAPPATAAPGERVGHR